MVLGYVRISTNHQDLQNQKNAIYEYAKQNKLLIAEFIEVQSSSRKNQSDRKLDEVFEKLNEKDILIISELSRLGRSVSEVVSLVNNLIDKKVRLVCIKENIDLKEKQTIQSKVMITMFSLFAELERDLISQRTKEALETKRANGVKLGRPKGPGKSRLDPKKEEIQRLLNKDIPVASIAKLIDAKYFTVFRYIKRKKLRKVKPTD